MEQGKDRYLVGLLLISFFLVIQSNVTEGQNTPNSPIQLSLTPSVVESGSGKSSVGYVHFLSDGTPSAPSSDIQIQLSSSDSNVASVPSSVTISSNQEFAKFDVVSGVEGVAEITASYDGQTSSQEFRVGDVPVIIPEDTDLSINLPSKLMRINTEMPMVIFLESNGTVIKVPRDISINFDYEKTLIEPKEKQITIKQGSYYAITTLKTLGKVGNAFIKASSSDLQLNSASSIQISSTEPAAIKVNVFPKLIGHSETKIDLFVSLVDSEGLPTKAANDIPLQVFSNSTRLQDSFDDKIETTPIIKKGQFGYHLTHEFTFLPRKQATPIGGECLQYQPDRIVIGANAANLGVGTDLLTVTEPLSENNKKAKDKIVRVFVLDKMPNNATSILGYQTGVLEKDDDDKRSILEKQRDGLQNTVDDDQDALNTANSFYNSILNDPNASQTQKDAAASAVTNANFVLSQDQAKLDDIEKQLEDCIINEDPIDDLDEGAFYPVQSDTIYSTNKIFSNLKLVSNNAQIVGVDNDGEIKTTSSYGVSDIFSGQKPGDASVSAILNGLGSGTNSTTVVNPIIASKSEIFTPLGKGKIIFNPEGYYDLYVVSLDEAGRPTTSKNPIKYIIEPINDFVEIKPQETFANMQGYKWPATNGTVNVSATPVGIDSESTLTTGTGLKLVAASNTAKVMVAFDRLAGIENPSPVGVVQILDYYGNPYPAPSDSKILLTSGDPKIAKVPSSVIIPQGKSFTEFPITTMTTAGTVQIMAGGSNFLPSSTELSVEPYQPSLKISFDPIATPLVTNNDVNVKLYVDNEHNVGQQGVNVSITTNTNSTASPSNLVTDSVGSANFVLRALHGKSISFTATASKEGYPTATKSMDLDVLYVPGLEVNWILYVAMAGAVAGVGIVALYFLRKPKELSDEEQEEI